MCSGTQRRCQRNGLWAGLSCCTRKNNPNNYRAICLLSHAYKVLSNILLRRIAAVDSKISDCQNGFRPKRGCRDNLYILREIIKDRIEQGRSAVCLFVDYRAAFYSVRHDYLQQALTEHGIPNKLVSLIMAIYRQAKAVVKGKVSDSRVFDIDRGVLQGDCLSPVHLHTGLCLPPSQQGGGWYPHSSRYSHPKSGICR